MVEDVEGVFVIEVSIDHTGIFGPSCICDIATNGKARITELLIVLHIVTPGHRHIINNPVVLVIEEHSLLEEIQFGFITCILCFVRLDADRLALQIILEQKLIWGQLNSLTKQHLARFSLAAVTFLGFHIQLPPCQTPSSSIWKPH